MNLEEYLCKVIEEESNKLILGYHAYHNALHHEYVRNTKRISNPPPKTIKKPSYWNIDKKFNPFYVKKKSKSIARSITKKISDKTYKPLPPHIKEIPKVGGAIRKVSIYQIPDAAVSKIYYNRLLAKNKHRFTVLIPSYGKKIKISGNTHGNNRSSCDFMQKRTMSGVRNPVETVGHTVVDFMTYMGGLSLLAAQTCAAVFRRGSPRRLQWIFHQMLSSGVHSLGVSGIIIFLVGMVIAFQTAYQTRSLGTETLIPGLIAVSIVRELGPMITALVVAGRAGAAMTAEIGTMTVTEQVDALKAMSVSPVEHLVLPRLVGIVLMMPILTIYTDAAGILGGYVVCVGKLGLTHVTFTENAFRALVLSDVTTGLSKSFVFGAVIAWVCCFEGLNVRGGAGGVGQATMRGVVASFVMVVLADFFFTVIFYLMPV